VEDLPPLSVLLLFGFSVISVISVISVVRIVERML